MEQDGQRGGVGGQDDNLRDTTVQRLGGLVGTLLQLAVVRSLLDQIEDLLRQSAVGDGPGGGVGGHFLLGFWRRSGVDVVCFRMGVCKARPG